MSENSTRRCRPETLAAQGPVRIDLCSCGQVHLSISALTVRLSPRMLQVVSDAARTALTRLERPAPASLPLH